MSSETGGSSRWIELGQLSAIQILWQGLHKIDLIPHNKGTRTAVEVAENSVPCPAPPALTSEGMDISVVSVKLH